MLSGSGRTATRSSPTPACTGASISRKLMTGLGYSRFGRIGVCGNSEVAVALLRVMRMLFDPAARISSTPGWPADIIGAAHSGAAMTRNPITIIAKTDRGLAGVGETFMSIESAISEWLDDGGDVLITVT